MALETATFIDDLNSANPAATDSIGQADDHIRLIKSAIKATFPNVDAAVNATPTELNTLDGITATTAELNILDGVTATATELNYVDGVTSAIQTQIDAKASTADATFTGDLTVPNIKLGDYTIEVGSGGTLDIKHGSTLIAQFSSAGKLTVDDDIVAFGGL